MGAIFQLLVRHLKYVVDVAKGYEETNPHHSIYKRDELTFINHNTSILSPAAAEKSPTSPEGNVLNDIVYL